MKAIFNDIRTGKLLGETEEFEIPKDLSVDISDMNEWCSYLLYEFSRTASISKDFIKIILINHND